MIASATSSNIKSKTENITALLALVFNLTDGYTIMAIKNAIIPINIIYIIVLAITYDIA